MNETCNNSETIKNEQNNNQHQNNHNHQNQKDYYYYNNYNNIHGAGRVLTPDDCELLREAYKDNIGPMTAAPAHILEDAFSAGLEVDELLMAIEETGLASRPSAYYLRAILRNWAQNGVTVSRTRNLVRANRATKWWD